MTNFELNKRLAELVITDAEEVCSSNDMWAAPESNPDAVQVIYKLGIHGEFKDYCANWNDIMPIAVELGITLKASQWVEFNKWSAYQSIADNYHQHWVNDESPQIALTKCCIEVLECK